uniref:phosphoribosylglycinamide formyltransferase 1 n=1 Tax=Oryza meridionalis TaxID=40149 RepID=A0A0E0E295_9ORYZ
MSRVDPSRAIPVDMAMEWIPTAPTPRSEAALAGELQGAKHARCSGILVVVFPNSKSALKGLSTDELLHTLRELRDDFILLAGYLKLIPVELVQVYPRSILNIHSSLLPAFGSKGYYGLKSIKFMLTQLLPCVMTELCGGKMVSHLSEAGQTLISTPKYLST